MTITTAQNVGIGTSSPNGRLQVTGGTTNASNLATAYSAAAFTLVPKSTSGFSLAFGSGPSDFPYIQMSAAGSVASDMLLQPYGGNVGIGTSSPASKLDVSGPASVTSFTGTTKLGVTTRGSTGATDYSGIDFIGGNQANPVARIAALTTGGGSTLSFGTSNNYANGITNTAMTIDVNGSLLVGTTSNPNTARINVQGVAGAHAANVRSGSSTGSGLTMIAFYDGSNDFCGQIAIDADANTTVYGTSSDYRLKNTIAPMTGALEKVALLKPVTYKWNSDGSDSDGFIAHELAEVCPHAVIGAKDAVDVDGNPQYQGIDTSFLVATLTAAIQEQQALIVQLQADVAELKGAA
jgi:hypothetical protein